MINRFSSRVNNLGEAFFKDALTDAISYDRIAGYFSSSIIEIAGEQIDRMKGNVRIVCNSQLQTDDVKFIKDEPQAMKLEWCEGNPEEELGKIPERLKNIRDLFGQIPDTLEDVWVEVALNRIAEAEKKISDFSESDTHPFYNKYQNQDNVKSIKWEDCSIVLDKYEKKKHLMKGW